MFAQQLNRLRRSGRRLAGLWSCERGSVAPLVGVAMITSAPEALQLHQKAASAMWRRALKGPDAADFLRRAMTRHRG